jgi:hypothetical protein
VKNGVEDLYYLTGSALRYGSPELLAVFIRRAVIWVFDCGDSDCRHLLVARGGVGAIVFPALRDRFFN